MKRAILFLTLTVLLYGCMAASEPIIETASQRYHDPSMGWTALLPSGWVACDIPGGQFVRGLSLKDSTRLILWTYKDKSVSDVRSNLIESGGVINQTEIEERETSGLNWIRYHAEARNDAQREIEFAVAADGKDTHLVLLVARKSEMDALVESVLLPVVDSFVPGPPDMPVSILATAPSKPDYWPTESWRTASPESQGLDAKQLEAMLTLIDKETIPLDSLTIIRHGYIVLNKAFPPFEQNELHELHSATKSVVSALVGIALNDSHRTVNTPVLDILSSHSINHVDDHKRSMTLEHLLTMTSGLDWVEWDAPYEHGTGNDLVLMIETAPDWTQYVLDQPMAGKPGDTFLYNSGASHVLSAVVTELSGKPAADFAAERLFAPLGINEFDWSIGPENVTAGWANLRMHPEDLARIGLLYLHRGIWDGKQIVPAAWVEASTTDQVADPLYEYGYQWWLDRADGYAFMAGRFGQVVIVAPQQDMVIVFTAHLSDTISDVGVTRWLAERFILPAVQ